MLRELKHVFGARSSERADDRGNGVVNIYHPEHLGDAQERDTDDHAAVDNDHLQHHDGTPTNYVAGNRPS